MSGFKKISTTGFSSFDSLQDSISSGIKTLDNIVDIVTGSIITIYEDKYSSIHNIILQVFASSCFNENKKFHILTTEEKVLKRFNRIESPKDQKIGNENLVIAWRYKSIESSKEQLNWDLLNKIQIDDKNTVKDLNDFLSILKTTKNRCFISFSFLAPLYDQFLSNDQKLTKNEFIHNLLYEIRKYVKLNDHILLMSFPYFLHNSNFSSYFDSILKIVNNLSLPQETPLYHCFLEIMKLSKPGSLLVNSSESNKYGLVLKSKCIQIEKIDVEPEEIIPKSTGCDSKF